MEDEIETVTIDIERINNLVMKCAHLCGMDIDDKAFIDGISEASMFWRQK